jgi:hypothetical protein
VAVQIVHCWFYYNNNVEFTFNGNGYGVDIQGSTGFRPNRVLVLIHFYLADFRVSTFFVGTIVAIHEPWQLAGTGSPICTMV